MQSIERKGTTYAKKRRQILMAARQCFEERGTITITATAKRLDLTRELLYYYFDGNKGLTHAVVESYVDDVSELFQSECAKYEALDWSQPGQARMVVGALVRTWHDFLFHANGAPRTMLSPQSNTWPTRVFLCAAVDASVQRLSETTLVRGLASEWEIDPADVLPLCKFILMGVIAVSLTGCMTNEDEITRTVLTLLGTQHDYKSFEWRKTA